jgi:hypothetical protein
MGEKRGGPEVARMVGETVGCTGILYWWGGCLETRSFEFERQLAFFDGIQMTISVLVTPEKTLRP